MTDKQIACIFLAKRLWGMIPDHEELRSIAEADLTEDQCYRICERITEMCEKMRTPLMKHLNRTGIDSF